MRTVEGGGTPAGADDRARFVQAYDAARAADDIDAMTEAALALAGMQVWGTVPGRLPAFLHEAYARAEGAQRARLAVAIARVWVTGGEHHRAEAFAAEALADAEQRSDPTALAAALDVTLLARWGPDDLDDRVAMTARLEDVVAHVSDVEAQMSAHLWRLTSALESLDRPAAVRQLRALDALADESGSTRVRFFAASRRTMFALLLDDVVQAREAAATAIAAGWAAGEADAYAIEHALKSAIARHTDDRDALRTEAAVFEEFAEREGVVSVAAEAAMLWAAAGEHANAARLLAQVGSAGFGAIARDSEWLLTVVSLTEAATALADRAVLDEAVRTLDPYAGRGVVNGGAVGFVGVVDDYLARALAVLGREDEARHHGRAAVDAYARVGAPWWARRVDRWREDRIPAITKPAAAAVIHLRPAEAGIWWIGHEGATVAVRDAKGLHYLRALLARPGADVAATDLSAAVDGRTQELTVDSGLEVLDRTALLAYKRRLEEIDAELDESHTWADPGRADRLDAEREALLAELRGATGLGGRARRTGGTDERARVAVRKAVAAAVKRIAAVDPAVARLIEDTVRTGTHCRYEPDPGRPTRWVLDLSQPAP